MPATVQALTPPLATAPFVRGLSGHEQLPMVDPHNEMLRNQVRRVYRELIVVYRAGQTTPEAKANAAACARSIVQTLLGAGTTGAYISFGIRGRNLTELDPSLRFPHH